MNFTVGPIEIVGVGTASSEGIEWSMEGGMLVCADIDKKKLSLALRNIVGNAIKYTASGGSVHVSAVFRVGTSFETYSSTDPPPRVVARGILRIEVRDTGIGVPAPRHECVFMEGGGFDIDGEGHGLGLWCK